MRDEEAAKVKNKRLVIQFCQSLFNFVATLIITFVFSLILAIILDILAVWIPGGNILVFAGSLFIPLFFPLINKIYKMYQATKKINDIDNTKTVGQLIKDELFGSDKMHSLSDSATQTKILDLRYLAY